jgi:hypothetical protein
MSNKRRASRSGAQNPPQSRSQTPSRGTVKVSTAPRVSYVRRRDCAKPTKIA